MGDMFLKNIKMYQLYSTVYFFAISLLTLIKILWTEFLIIYGYQCWCIDKLCHRYEHSVAKSSGAICQNLTSQKCLQYASDKLYSKWVMIWVWFLAGQQRWKYANFLSIISTFNYRNEMLQDLWPVSSLYAISYLL